jgi:hypothetical protein
VVTDEDEDEDEDEWSQMKKAFLEKAKIRGMLSIRLFTHDAYFKINDNFIVNFR